MTWVNEGQLQDYLDTLCAKHGVVGASLVIRLNGEETVAASGVVNLNSNVPVTPETIFQIGSIGKLFTATQIMQLVEQGKLSLDTKIVDVLREFAIADLEAAKSITVRHLLTHTSGMEGDFFPDDDPEGPSALSYVRKMRLLPSFYAPGDGPMTYCNSGYVVLGRMIEVLTGKPWPIAVMDQVCKPLGLTTAFADPKESLRFNCAMGHMGNPPAPAPVTYLMLSAAAAGTALSMSATDLLEFGNRVSKAGVLLNDHSIQAMHSAEVELPPFTRADITHWGLGWMVGQHDGYTTVGHDGGTLGQYAYMRLYPDHDASFALLTNSPSGELYEEFERDFLRDIVEVKVVDPTPPAIAQQDHTDFAGVYESLASRMTVLAKVDGFSLTVQDKAFGAPDISAALKPYATDIFTPDSDHPALKNKIVFLRNNQRDVEFMRMGVRMFKRA